MGSHYIQVGKLKIDQDLMDVICPAAGYTPEVICPANGYVLEPGVDDYEPPIELGTPSSEQIWLLCSNTGTKCLKIQCGVSGGNWNVDVYDGNGNYIQTSANFGNYGTFIYYFPAGYDYFIFKFKLTGPYSFTLYKNGSYSSAPQYGNYPILEAKFNTPNITSFEYAFYNVTSIRKVSFISSLNYLNTMRFMFYGSGMKVFTFPSSLPALSSVQAMFKENNTIEKIDLSTSNLPLLNNLYEFVKLSSSIYEVKFPASLPEATTFQMAFDSSSLVKVQMPTSAPKVTTYSYIFNNCYFLDGEVNIPESQVCTSLQSAFRMCYKIKKVTIQGIFSALTIMSDIFYSCKTATELEYPRIIGTASSNYNTFYLCYALKKVKFPDYASSTEFITVNSSHKPNIEEFHGDCEAPNSAIGSFDYRYPMVAVVNMPKYKTSKFYLGEVNAIAPVTYIDIDWANSIFNPASNPAIRLYCNIDATEINRIFTLLAPAVSTEKITVSGCPGFATCDPSIATAKGWTVL